MKVKSWKLILRAIAFLLIFFTLLSMLTMILLPKWQYTKESAQMPGLYKEPENTIDVLGLGSCNMYTSMSADILYEKYGITGYAFCCPDQELSTSYHFLKEALKRQTPKVVIVESLFLTLGNSSHREYYNRYALDYMPMSFNKLQLAAHIAKTEPEVMREYNPTASDTLLTFASYVFPALRYHARADLIDEDVTFFRDNDLYNWNKGNWPEYNYTTNDGNYFNKLFNKAEINAAAREYFPKIKALCEENGIKLYIMKSPNYARWGYDDTQTKIVRDFAEEMGVPFIDFHSKELNKFEEYDYGFSTGRLNVYGSKKLSTELGQYLVDNAGLEPTELSEENAAKWNECVEKYYEEAEEAGCNIREGQLAQLSNTENAICVRWNPCDDSKTYSLYRCVGKDGKFELIDDKLTGNIYDDTDVEAAQGYSYYVVPNEGALKGQKSGTMYYVFVDMPKNLTAYSNGGVPHLEWDDVETFDYFRIQRRTDTAFNFTYWDKNPTSSYNNFSVKDGTEYYYRVATIIEEDGVQYESETAIVSCAPIQTPKIVSNFNKDGANVIVWNKAPCADSITVYRRAADESAFTKCEVLSGDATSYTDSEATPGMEYFYKIVSELTTETNGTHAVSEPSNTVGIKA